MPRKGSRKPGDLTQLRGVLWQTIIEVEALLNTRPPSNELVLKSAHALSQLAGTYQKLVEGTDHEARIKALEEKIRVPRKTS